MGDYLKHVVMRSQIDNESQNLQPFICSESPIADRDQRIGMAGFEDLEFGLASSAETNPELGMTSDRLAQESISPEITAANPSGEGMVQRKMASSTTASPEVSVIAKSESVIPAIKETRFQQQTPISPIIEQQMLPETEPIIEQPILSEIKPSPLEPDNITQIPQLPTESSSLSELHELMEAAPINNSDFAQPNQTLYPSEQLVPSKVFPETEQLKDSSQSESVNLINSEKDNAVLETSPSQVALTDEHVLSSTAIPSIDTIQKGKLNEIQSRLVGQVQQTEVPSLEPLTRTITSQSESAFNKVSDYSSNEISSPRVVIGRINVEVVPPPKVESSAKAAKPTPLTAESVSVIGPLGSRISSNVRFSLRQR